MSNGQIVYIFGRWSGHDCDQWHLQGVFLTRDEALAACRDRDYFIGTEIVGVSLPHDREMWDIEYPLATK